MSNKYSALVLGAIMGLGSLAFSSANASAAAMLPLSSPAVGEANTVNNGVIQVNHKKKWHKKNFNYCNDWNGGCHNYRRRHHFDGSYLFLPLVIGGGYGASDYYDNDYGDYDDYDGGGLSSRHVQWCLNRYQSYNPRYNTWVAYSGKVKKCYSPYM